MHRLERPLPIIGMIHLLPLPGAPAGGRDFRSVLARARHEAVIYRRTGVDALMIENHGDIPFAKDDVAPHVPAIMGTIAWALAEEFHCPVGVNVLRNDAMAALGAAVPSGAAFVRVNVLSGVTATDQGLIEGKGAEVVAYRRSLGLSTEIWADAYVKYGTPLYAPGLATCVESLAHRGGADRILITGTTTGRAPDVDALVTAKKAAGTVPVLIASGLSLETLETLFPHCDGAIVGSAFRHEGKVENDIEPALVTDFMHAVRAMRKARGVPV
jgi:uncharacterized protein